MIPENAHPTHLEAIMLITVTPLNVQFLGASSDAGLDLLLDSGF